VFFRHLIVPNKRGCYLRIRLLSHYRRKLSGGDNTLPIKYIFFAILYFDYKAPLPFKQDAMAADCCLFAANNVGNLLQV